jgi:hypothetical protein
MKAVIFFLLLSSMCGAPLYSQVNIGGTMVPKDSIIVFIGIGHSNMAGRAQIDTAIHNRCWNYRIDTDTHGWEPAKDPMHCEFCNNNADVCWSKGGGTFQLIKKLAETYPGYHFGVVQNAHSSASITNDDDTYCNIIGGGTKYYKKGGMLYNEIIAAVKEIRDQVTIGGVFTEIGQLDRYVSTAIPRFATDFAAMITAMRADLGIPDLPFYVMQLEAGGTATFSATNASGKAIISQINKIPTLVNNCVVVSTAWSTQSGMMEDDHHFSLQGNRRLAEEIVGVIQASTFTAWSSSGIRPYVSFAGRSHSNIFFVISDNGIATRFFGRGEYTLYSLAGKRLLSCTLDGTGSGYVIPFSKGMYIVRSNDPGWVNGREQFLLVK